MRLMDNFREFMVPVLAITMTICVQSRAAASDVDFVGQQETAPECMSQLSSSLNHHRTRHDWLAKQAIGFKCQVSGRAWLRTDKAGFGEAWKDLSTGITWSENLGLATNIGHSEIHLVSGIDFVIDSDAVLACRAVGGELPKVSDFVTAQGNYFTWILPQFAKTQTPKYRDDNFVYWTKNVRPDNKFAIVFDAVNGYGAIDRSTRASVRCISR